MDNSEYPESDSLDEKLEHELSPEEKNRLRGTLHCAIKRMSFIASVHRTLLTALALLLLALLIIIAVAYVSGSQFSYVVLHT